MADFEEMASKAKKAAEAQAEAEAQKAMEEETVRSARMKEGQTVLERTVLPLLQKAKDAFEKNGVPCLIDTEFDVSSSRNPRVVFRCAGPTKINQAGGESEPQSTPVFVESDGTSIDVGLGDYAGEDHPQRKFGSSDEANAEDLISAAIEIALDSYYAEVARLRQMGLWD